MPFILKADEFDAWLESDGTDYLQALLQPYEETDLEIYPVSREVSYPKNDYAGLLESI